MIEKTVNWIEDVILLKDGGMDGDRDFWNKNKNTRFRLESKRDWIMQVAYSSKANNCELTDKQYAMWGGGAS